jgi:hypothetical protein
MSNQVLTRERTDGRSPGLLTLPGGAEVRVDPGRERAVSSALERALLTLLLILALLCGGILFVREVAAAVGRIGVAVGVGR